jgi:ribose-phosphate pyrophosphokinase
MTKRRFLFAGSSHPDLARQICLSGEVTLGRLEIRTFPDGETSVQVLEDVRGEDVFVLQSVVRNPNHYLMELLIILDALKRSAAKSITVIIPYFGYCRQDRRDRLGVPITAKLVAGLLEKAGMSFLITFDLHADQAEGFFEVPVEHLRAQKLLSKAASEHLGKDAIVVAPDVGSTKIAERMAKLLGVHLAVMKKVRLSPSEVSMTLIGSVKGKNVLIIDDLCSTGGTLVTAAELCKKEGANRVIAAVTHALFIGDSKKKIESSDLDRFFFTDTIPEENLLLDRTRMEIVPVASMLRESILIR